MKFLNDIDYSYKTPFKLNPFLFNLHSLILRLLLVIFHNKWVLIMLTLQSFYFQLGFMFHTCISVDCSVVVWAMQLHTEGNSKNESHLHQTNIDNTSVKKRSYYDENFAIIEANCN